MKICLALSLLLLNSCAIGRRVRLKNFAYDLGKTANINVEYLKRTEDKLEIKLLGISMDEFPVMIKTDEIECGVDGDKFEKVTIDSLPNGYIVFPKTSYQDFTVLCLKDGDMERGATPFIIFKKVYQQQANLKPGKVITTNLKMKFE